MAPIDLALAALLALALARGLAIGLIREVLSLAALAGACLAGFLFAGSAGAELGRWTGGALPPAAATLAGGLGVALAVFIAVRLAGRLLARGAHAVGLAVPDRLAGGLLGLAEGAVVALLLVRAAIAVLGPDHPQLEGTRAIAAWHALERALEEAPGAVASPPPRR